MTHPLNYGLKTLSNSGKIKIILFTLTCSALQTTSAKNCFYGNMLSITGQPYGVLHLRYLFSSTEAVWMFLRLIPLTLCQRLWTPTWTGWGWKLGFLLNPCCLRSKTERTEKPHKTKQESKAGNIIGHSPFMRRPFYWFMTWKTHTYTNMKTPDSRFMSAITYVIEVLRRYY